MEMGIFGLPQSGKSTLFEIMTGVKSGASHSETVVRGQASVPDERFDKLVEIYKPVKVSPAKVPFVDVHAVGEHPWEAIRQNLSGTDGILHVVDGFSLPDVSLSLDAYRKLEDELVFSDLLIIEKKLERLAKMSNKKAISPQETAQNDLLPRLKECLEAGKPLRTAGLTPAEVFMLRSFSFWTIKPELVVVNVAEDNLSFADAFAQEAKLIRTRSGNLLQNRGGTGRARCRRSKGISVVDGHCRTGVWPDHPRRFFSSGAHVLFYRRRRRSQSLGDSRGDQSAQSRRRHSQRF